MSDNNFGERLSYVLGLHNLTQKEAGKRAEISQNAFVNYVKNRRIPAGDVLERIARLCDVSIEYLISGTINQNYCYEIASTIRLNRISMTNLSVKLSVTEQFLKAIVEHRVSPSTEFFKQVMEAIGVTPKGNLHDRAAVPDIRFCLEPVNHDTKNRVDYLRFRIEKLNQDLSDRDVMIEKLFTENESLKLENEELKRQLKQYKKD
jgi:transcriptional regulator with XRE-family HTH domain